MIGKLSWSQVMRLQLLFNLPMKASCRGVSRARKFCRDFRNWMDYAASQYFSCFVIM
jgi:hypothetical protein